MKKYHFMVILFLFTLTLPYSLTNSLSFLQNLNDTTDINASLLPFVDGESLSSYGEIVTGIGDYNMDGFEDFAVGGRMWGAWQGKAWIYFGSSTGRISNSESFSIKGEPNIQDSGLCFGHTLINLGDANQDGVTDFAVGGPGSWGGWTVGKVFVFYGDSDSYPSKAGEDSDQSLVSPINYDWLGETMASIGDFNGDSNPDIVVGAPGTNYFGEDSTYPYEYGHAYVYLGTGAGFNTDPDLTLTDKINRSNFGLALGAGGDINNDGLDDFIVSAMEFNQSRGQVYLYLGNTNPDPNLNSDLIFTANNNSIQFGATATIISDINNDNFDEIVIKEYREINGDSYSYINLYLGSDDIQELMKVDYNFTSGNSLDDFGYSITSVGDLNGDNYGDFTIGAPSEILYTEYPGKAYLYYGGENFDTIPDVIFTGEEADSSFGFSVGFTDLNNDDRNEILISAIRYGNKDEGRVYIYSPIKDPSSDEYPFLTRQDIPSSSISILVMIVPFFIFVITKRVTKKRKIE